MHYIIALSMSLSIVKLSGFPWTLDTLQCDAVWDYQNLTLILCWPGSDIILNLLEPYACCTYTFLLLVYNRGVLGKFQVRYLNTTGGHTSHIHLKENTVKTSSIIQPLIRELTQSLLLSRYNRCFWYMWWVTCGFGFIVNRAIVEQLSMKSETLKHDIYMTANFLWTSEATTKQIGWYLVPSVVKVSIYFISYWLDITSLW